MERSFDATVFTKNRQRLMENDMGRALFDEVVWAADGEGLLSDEHFSVDGTLIEAAASLKSFRPKNPDGTVRSYACTPCVAALESGRSGAWGRLNPHDQNGKASAASSAGAFCILRDRQSSHRTQTGFWARTLAAESPKLAIFTCSVTRCPTRN